MDSKERRLVILLLSIAFTMMFAGYIFVPFVVNFWTYIANLAGEKDVFLACTLIIYFAMFCLFGATVGVLINAYGVKALKSLNDFARKQIRKSKSQS